MSIEYLKYKSSFEKYLMCCNDMSHFNVTISTVTMGLGLGGLALHHVVNELFIYCFKSMTFCQIQRHCRTLFFWIV